MITPTAIAMMAILIIGAEMLLLYDFVPIRRFAMKRSRFNSLNMKDYPMILGFKSTVFAMVFMFLSCGNGKTQITTPNTTDIDTTEETSKPETRNPMTRGRQAKPTLIGANQLEKYLPLLENKKIGVVGNQTSIVFKKAGFVHLIDTLLSKNVNIVKVFAPEHGFRGTADAGETINDSNDSKTGLPILSLYGNNKKPNAKQLENIDVMIFDIQDVGARFYTYISTLHYIMEACAENDIPLIVLDRPNPNGHYIDGPILEEQHQSFVGMHPIPVVHGMTIGEYAQMINGEGWLPGDSKAELTVIPVANYNKSMPYGLPVKPSPNLPNDFSVSLYPSLCFFEGTNVNAGRGTDKQFQVFGSPFLNPKKYTYTYTPKSNPGAKYPKHEDKLCYGMALTPNVNNTIRIDAIQLEYLIDAYNNTADKAEFFNDFFVKLAGTETLKQQIESGITKEAIVKSWQQGLKEYDQMRKQYELY